MSCLAKCRKPQKCLPKCIPTDPKRFRRVNKRPFLNRPHCYSVCGVVQVDMIEAEQHGVAAEPGLKNGILTIRHQVCMIFRRSAAVENVIGSPQTANMFHAHRGNTYDNFQHIKLAPSVMKTGRAHATRPRSSAR